MKVAILLAAYNGGEYIHSQLVSLSTQVSIDFDVFIRDDGSTDNTFEIVKEFCKKDSRFKIVQDNYGSTGTAAENFFRLIIQLDISKYSHVALADQDDIWDPKKLINAKIIMDTGYSGYSSNLLAFDASKAKSWYVKKHYIQTEIDYFFQGASAGCTYVFDKQLFLFVKQQLKNAKNNYLTNISHDWLIYALARSNGFKWYFDEKAFIFYRQHGKNVYGDVGFWGNISRKFNLLRSGWYRSQIIQILQLTGKAGAGRHILGCIESDNLIARMGLLKYVLKARRRRFESIVIVTMLIVGFV